MCSEVAEFVKISVYGTANVWGRKLYETSNERLIAALRPNLGD